MRCRTRSPHLSFLPLLLAAALLTACASGAAPTRTPPASPTSPAVEAQGPAEAVAQIREMLHHALETYARGDADKAYALAADAYLEGFEELEEELVQQGHRELVEGLELKFKALRDGIRAGQPQAELQKLVTEIEQGLDEVLNVLTTEK